MGRINVFDNNKNFVGPGKNILMYSKPKMIVFMLFGYEGSTLMVCISAFLK